jgi:hypothetical protein
MNERQLLSLPLFLFIEFEWRVSHFNFLFFVNNYSHIVYIQTGTTILRVYESDISYEGQVNWTQQEYNLLGQRVVCQYIYMYWLWITVWSEVQIEVDDREREGERQTRLNERKTNLTKLVIHIVIIWSSFTSKQGHWNEKNKRDIEASSNCLSSARLKPKIL